MALHPAKAVIGYLKDRPEETFIARQPERWVKDAQVVKSTGADSRQYLMLL